MKKVALSLLALAVVGVSAFADAPKWDPKVSTGFTGKASVTLGYDLDTGTAALLNSNSLSLTVDLITGGTNATKSDKDVWGEIAIKTDGDPVRYIADGVASDGKVVQQLGPKLQLDFAKIHFGKAAYLSVSDHGTQLGYASSPDLAFYGHSISHTTPEVVFAAATDGKLAVAAVAAIPQGTRYGVVGKGLSPAWEKVGADNAGGAEFGYSLEKVASVTVDVGTTDKWDVSLVNARAKTNVAYKAAVGLLAVDNLTLEAGYSSSTIDKGAKAVGGKVAYKYAIDGDKLYVKPSAGVSLVTGAGADKSSIVAHGGVLLGTGAKAAQFDNYDLKADDDYAAYPGVAVGVFYDDSAVVFDVGTKKVDLGLSVSANSGALIKDVTVVAAYEVVDLNATNVLSYITVGASGAFTTGDVKFAPKGMLVSQSGKGSVDYYKDNVLAKADSSLFAKADLEVTGVIPFVTFVASYASNDLVNGFSVKNDKMGKFEFKTQVNF